MRAVLALVLTLLLVAPSLAHAQTDEASAPETADAGAEGADGNGEHDEADEAEEQATEGGGYEPDQRGYEPDQRGYEPDQRGYEPDQRGYGEEEESERTEAEPTVMAGEAAERRYDIGARLLGLDAQLWLGGALTGVDAIGGENLVRPSQRGTFGASLGLVAALRVGPVSVGPRVGLVTGDGATLVSFGGDVQLALTEDRFAPFVRASLSYVFLAGLSDALPSQGEALVDGVLAELGVGVRFRIAGPLVVGAELAGGYLHLERGAVPTCEAPCTDGDFDLARPGSADGLTLRLHLSVGVRF